MNERARRGAGVMVRWHRLLIGVLVVPLPVLAQTSSPGDVQLDRAPTTYDRSFEEWKEEKTEFPPYPRDADLIRFEVAGSAYEHYIDRASLSLGRDEVLRYTVVLEAGRARNVLYEGIRCETREYRTLGYATSGEEFRARRDSGWVYLYPSGASGNDYRWVLWHRYLCTDAGQWMKVEDVVARLLAQ